MESACFLYGNMLNILQPNNAVKCLHWKNWKLSNVVKFNFYCVYLICCKFFGYLFQRIDILKDVLIFANFMFLRIFFLSNPSRCKQKQRRKNEMYFRHHTAPCLRIKSEENTLKYSLMFHSFFIFKIQLNVVQLFYLKMLFFLQNFLRIFIFANCQNLNVLRVLIFANLVKIPKKLCQHKFLPITSLFSFSFMFSPS